ncbi:MAG: OmpA family protein, partial [Proteobacteria bacterium]|nr:OmpA family protein [Pseudomonadota bacterium]
LSTRRANAVRTYMIDHGIAATRMVAIGLGEALPATHEATEEGWAQNRRVVLSVERRQP